MSYLTLGDENNDDDFAPSLGGMSSNLGSLFGMNAQMDNRAGSNQSLTYTAPKPPRPDKPQQDTKDKKSSGSSGVAAAVAITAFKYVGNQYQSQGKLGMALLSNYSEKDFKVLMYVSKQQPVATAKISSDFQFNIQSNNYASFHDDQRQAWSILFPAFEQLHNFAKQVCVAKYHSQTEHGVVTQDILLGESETPPLALGDSVEAKYTGWLMSSDNGTIGNVFDSNHDSDKFFRFKTGKGKVIKGWEEGMLGMKKGGKRFLIIPPFLAYGSKSVGSRVPPNSTLAFEVDIVRLKSSAPNAPTGTSNVLQAEQSESVERSRDPSVGSSEPSVESINIQHETIKARASSIHDQMSGAAPAPNASTGKGSLVSRMAKVGQPMLPVRPTMQAHEPQVKPPFQPEQPPRPSPIVAASPEPYHSSQPDTRSTYSNSPGLAVQSVANVAVMPSMEYQRVGYSPQPMQPASLPMMQPVLTGNVNIQPPGVMGINDISRQAYHSSTFPQHFASSGVEMLPAILAESQNSSYKLKSLMEKVDEVSEKVSKLKSESNEYKQTSELMDAAQISFNIQRILQENERVKKQIIERDKLVQQQSDKIANLLQQNHKLIEESHEQITKRSVTFNERMGLTHEKTAKLEQEKLEMSNKLSEATSKVYDLQLQLANATERTNSLEKIAKSSAGQIENEVRIRQLENELSSARESLAAAQSENKKLEMKSQESTAVAVQERDKRNETKHGLELEITNLKKEIDTMKLRHEKVLFSIQEKYQSLQIDSVHQQQQLEDNWKEKCKNAVTKVSQAAEERIRELGEENEELSKKLEVFQKKMLQMRQMYQDKVSNEEKLETQLAGMVVFKQKYENLRKQAISMKQQYEDKISELQEANDGHDHAPEAQIKSVMNQVFQDIRAKIDRDEEYSGSEILSSVLSVIKSATLNLLTSKQPGNEEDQTNAESDGGENESSDDDAKSEGGNSDLSPPSQTPVAIKPGVPRKPVLETQIKPSQQPIIKTLVKSESEAILLTSKRPDDEEDQANAESDGGENGSSDDDAKSEGGNSDLSPSSQTPVAVKPEVPRKPVLETQTKASQQPIVETLIKSESEAIESAKVGEHDDQETITEERNNDTHSDMKAVTTEKLEAAARDKDDGANKGEGSLSPLEDNMQEKASATKPETVPDERQQINDSSTSNEASSVIPQETQNRVTTSEALVKEEAANVDDIADDAFLEDTKPTPPPLFDDDDDDDDDLGWLS